MSSQGYKRVRFVKEREPIAWGEISIPDSIRNGRCHFCYASTDLPRVRIECTKNFRVCASCRALRGIPLTATDTMKEGSLR